MSKLDWARAGLRSSDPARVVDVGDYGILPDHLAGRKGNLKPRRKSRRKRRLSKLRESSLANQQRPAISPIEALRIGMLGEGREKLWRQGA